MTKQELERLNWSDISITKNDDGSPLIILIFNTQKDADGAALGPLSKHPFRFDLSRTAQGSYNFDLVFLDSDYAIRYESKLSAANYPPLTWLKKDAPTYLTTGWWVDGTRGQYQRLAPMLQIENFNIQ